MRPGPSLSLILACGLAACAGKRVPPQPLTLNSLASRQVMVEPDAGIARSEDKAIAAYKAFLDAAPNAPQRAHALRRLGDLEMDSADSKGSPDYRAAVARYQERLRAYPNDQGNDRVLYQLARAHEQGGDLDAALRTLDRLVAQHPGTAHRDEAHFRRGELLFTARDYVRSEAAYATVLEGDAEGTFHERALYMHGWSLFKQGRLEEALHSFFGVLDRKVAGREGDGELDSLGGLSRADRELVEDTLRVTSLSLAHLQGAGSIDAYVGSDTRRSYEFRVYQQLGELYIKQERTKDAADTLGLFARRRPLHAQAPQLSARVIGIYEQAGFAGLALEAKKEYVARYGVDSEFRRANPEGWARVAQPLVKTHLGELARHHHAIAQQSKAGAGYQEAARWYRVWLASFPNDAQAAQNNFLLAELLFEDRRYAEASAEYEKSAYAYARHAKSADAGYSALLAHAKQEVGDADKRALRKAAVASALRFADAFGDDPRASAVLADAAEKLYALDDADAAAAVARRVIALDPPAAIAERRVAWTVVAHTAFDRAAFDEAERAYAQALAIVPQNDAARGELVQRQAAAVYKQGEAAREAGNTRDAVSHFARVASVAPQSAVHASAQYDAAAALIGLKDWAAASRMLEDFRQRFPHHALQGDVNGKLALAYVEQGQWAQAAGEFERLAVNQDPQVARDALWQAAELHEKAGARAGAARAYERYVKAHPEPLEPALVARSRLARIARDEGHAARELALMKEILDADQRAGSARTERTRHLGATAALALAQPVFDAYRKVALVEPLARNLKLKKARLEEALKACALAADYGVADVTTAATFHTAALYHDFGRAMLASQRPAKLSKAEREQYDVMLEEQAFPFEEKAAELHEVNARRSVEGIYDEWVRKSFDALRELRPARWAKAERDDGALASAPQSPQQLNHLGVTHRQQGRFAQAREAYEKAIALDPQFAPAHLNLGILHDLYLGDGAKAMALYDRYLLLSPAGDATVTKWIAELKNRKAGPA